MPQNKLEWHLEEPNLTFIFNFNCVAVFRRHLSRISDEYLVLLHYHFLWYVCSHSYYYHYYLRQRCKKGPNLRTRFAENNFKFVVPQKMLSKCHAKVINMIRCGINQCYNTYLYIQFRSFVKIQLPWLPENIWCTNIFEILTFIVITYVSA